MVLLLRLTAEPHVVFEMGPAPPATVFGLAMRGCTRVSQVQAVL